MPTDPLEEGLTCEEEMPFEWTVVEDLPGEQQLAAQHVSNEALIRACEALEETHRAGEEFSELAHELARIESKLNLVLELLGEWLRAHGELPPRRVLRFNATGLEWQAPEGPPAGALVQLRLHLCPAFPRPLQLHGEVQHSEPGTGSVHTVVRFTGIPEGVADGLERLIFRRHRREVAQIRGRDRARGRHSAGDE
jgi:hypothetical protein